MAGNLSIPNIIGAQPGGSINASLWDQNYTAVRDYVNTREITFGPIASRPAGVAGQWWAATDQGYALSAHDGTAWRSVGPSFVIAALSPSNTGTVNSAALQAAINGAPAGALIFLASGSYAMDGAVTINKALTLLGAGRGGTSVNFAAGALKILADDAVTVMNLTVTSAGGPHALSVDGLTGIGNGNSMLLNLAVSSTAGDAISILGAYNVTIDNTQASSYFATGSGIRLANHFAPDSGGYIITSCVLKGRLAGLRHDSGAGLQFIGNVIFDPDHLNQYGILLQGTFLVPAAETMIVGNDIATSTVMGIFVNPATPLPGAGYYAGLQIVSNNIRGDQGDGGGVTVINGGAAALNMVGNTIGAGSNKAIVVELGANGITYTGNHHQHATANSVGLALLSAAANAVVGGNLWYANIKAQGMVTVDPAATDIFIKDVQYLFAALPTTPIANGSMVYVEDGTPSSDPLSGAGGGALALRQSGAWRGL